MKYLITGGAGYIGSTICSALEDEGHTPIILDSLITGQIEFTRGRIFYQADIADTSPLESIFREHPDIEAVVHCAALIVVPESMEKPYEYYRENVAKSLELFRSLETWAASGSSSAPPPRSMTSCPASWSPRNHRSNPSAPTPAPSSPWK